MRVEFRPDNKLTGVLPKFQDLLPAFTERRSYAFTVKSEVSIARVSAVIITLNEENIIPKTLSKLWWCDEIIIVDSGSTDRTVEICKEYGCTVFHRSFTGFGEQKNYGVSKAAHEWILCIDADEILSEPLIEEIRSELSKSEIVQAAFRIPLNLVFVNKIFKHGKESDATAIRLFNKNRGHWDGSIVHESLQIEGPIKTLKNKILHYSYQDYNQFITKINLYSSLGAQKLLEKKSGKGKLIVLLSIPFNFFKYYIVERNFLNGYRGLAWSAINTFYHFLKYLKLDELKKSGQPLLNEK
jgi:glycosyltransferase involved in cell wall biosynthesis